MGFPAHFYLKSFCPIYLIRQKNFEKNLNCLKITAKLGEIGTASVQ